MPQPIATWNSARDVWETDQASICGHWAVFSEIFVTSGMTLRGTALPLPASEHLMDDSESSSLLGTPRVDMGGAKSAEGYAKGAEKSRLEGQVGSLLPTPAARDWKDADASPAAMNRHSPPIVALLKTPTAQLAVNGGSQHPDKRKEGGHGPTLADEVEHLLPTPRATDGTKGGPNQRGSSGDLMLPSAVMPTATPYGSNQSPSPGAAVRPSLDTLFSGVSTGPPSADGKAS